MRVAVTGASGFVGAAATSALLAAGHEVLALSRRAVPVVLGLEWRRWDVAAGPLKDPGPVDAVVHAAALVDDWAPWPAHHAVTVEGTRHVLDTFPASRVVLVSSCSVYPLRAPGQLFPESVPVTTRPLSPYARAKIAQERVVAARPDHLVLRPHAVHGAGDPTLLPRLAQARRHGLLLVPGGRRTLVHVTDVRLVAVAVVAAVESTVQGLVNVADADPVPLGRLARDLAAANGWSEQPVTLGAPLSWLAASVSETVSRALPGRRRPLLTRYGVSHLAVSRTFPTDRLRDELGVSPAPTDVSDWRPIVHA